MSSKLKKLFLYQIYHQWRALFYVCCILILGTLTSAFIIGQSVTPFYVFQMYSQPFPKVDDGNTARIYVNGKELNTFLLYQETGDIIRSNMNGAAFLRETEYKDKYYFKLKEVGIGKFIPEICYQKILSYKKQPDEVYANWLKNYLQSFIAEDIKSLALTNQYYQYNQDGKPLVINEVPVFKFTYE
jgi:hypothetical protein